MTDEVRASKQALRDAARARLAELSAAEIAGRSAEMVSALTGTGMWARAVTVMLYLPLPREVDLTGCLAGFEKRFAGPRVDWAHGTMTAAVLDPGCRGVVVGRHGVREPAAGAPGVPDGEIDLVLVPGLAFDHAGGRLGRGGGFYDRFLARLREKSPDVVVCGVCFSEQVIDAVPRERTDVGVHMLLTDGGLRRAGG